MLGDERTVLERMQEFERTFEQNYGRKMTDEEQCILKGTGEIIQQKLGAYSEEPLVFVWISFENSSFMQWMIGNRRPASGLSHGWTAFEGGTYLHLDGKYDCQYAPPLENKAFSQMALRR